jgi:hypothetical protein
MPLEDVKKRKNVFVSEPAKQFLNRLKAIYEQYLSQVWKQ